GRDHSSPERIPGAIVTEAYTHFQDPPSPARGQRPLPAIDRLQGHARSWGLRPEATVVIYDFDRSMTAARAWWTLKWAGVPDVRVLDGGFPAWLAAGLPTTRDAPAPTPSDIVLTPGHMPEFDGDEAARLAEHGLLLDARIRANYIGGPTGPGEPRRGHIPGAISAPTIDNLLDSGVFADSATLREMYRGLGVTEHTAVGVYCGAGMSAAHTVLALAAIGIDAAMYPGSWSQYISEPAHPAVVGARVY
ncbi:MAG: rhodanese-like domain-containing protein, partial [Gordonia sp. (in: high G+C Gram-positive bacteria)]